MRNLAAIQMTLTDLIRKTKTIVVCYFRTIECETCECKVGIQQQLIIDFPSPFSTIKITKATTKETGNSFHVAPPYSFVMNFPDCDYSEMYICSCNFKSIHFKVIIQNISPDTYCHIEWWMPKYCSNEKLILVQGPRWVNSLAPDKFEWNFRYVIFKQILVFDGWCIYCDIALIWMSLDFTDDLGQHWFRSWLGAVRQQAITWTNVNTDLYRHMASLGHNVKKRCGSNKSSAELMLTYLQWDTKEYV